MSGQQHEKTRERAPANLGIKFNPALGATNTKRFDATVRALLKSNQESGELALAVLEGRANSSKESLVLFEPRATDYAKVLAVLKDTKDEAKALAAGKAEARSVEDVKPDEHIAFMRKVLDIKQKLFALLLHNSTDEGKKVFEHLEHDVVQAWQEIVTHAPEVPRSTLQSLQKALISGTYFQAAINETTGEVTYRKWQRNESWKTNLKNMKMMHTTLKAHVNKLQPEERPEYDYSLSEAGIRAGIVRSICEEAHTCVDGIKRALAANTTSQVTAGDLSFLYKTIIDWQESANIDIVSPQLKQ